MVKLLLSSTADAPVHVDDPEPVDSHPEMVKLLLSSGADANLRDHKGCTAFDLASLVDSSPDMVGSTGGRTENGTVGQAATQSFPSEFGLSLGVQC